MGALRAAKALGIATGGYAPKGWRTEAGDRPSLGIGYGLLESDSTDYAERTYQNIDMANAVILVALNWDSPGTKLTSNYCRQMGVPLFEVHMPRLTSLHNSYVVGDIQLWLDHIKPAVLMVAGNRESRAPGIENWTARLVRDIFS